MLFDDYEAMDIDDLMEKYGDRIKKEDYDDEIIKNMASTLVDVQKIKIENYKSKIKDVYTAIAAVKKMDFPNGDTYSIKKLIENIIYLRNDVSFYCDEELKEKLCNNVYKDLTEDDIYSRYYDIEMEEDYKPDHLFDIEYHLNNFKKYCNNKKFIDVLDIILNNGIWRYF